MMPCCELTPYDYIYEKDGERFINKDKLIASIKAVDADMSKYDFEDYSNVCTCGCHELGKQVMH